MLPIHKSRDVVFNYDEIPAGYYYQAMHTGKAVQRFWHRKKFEDVARRVPANSTVLDVGCGPGSFLEILGQTRQDVTATGIDIASRQINFAQQTVGPQFQNNRIRFMELPAGKPAFPFPNGTFDAVTSIEVIEHIHPFLASQLLFEMRRVLKPDGKLIVTTPNYRSLWPLIELGLEYLSPVKYHEQHIAKYTPNSLVKFLEGTGFQVQHVSTVFRLAPFLAGIIGMKAAEALDALENKVPGLSGSLLVAESKKRVWDWES